MTRMLTALGRDMLSGALRVLRGSLLEEPEVERYLRAKGIQAWKAPLAWDALTEARVPLGWAGDHEDKIAAIFDRAVESGLANDGLTKAERRRRERILRARLALAIRAVLRADRGEFGDWWAIEWPNGVGLTYDSHGHASIIAAGFGDGTVRRREALWTTAPGHEVDR